MKGINFKGGSLKRRAYMLAAALSVLFLLQLLYNSTRLLLASDPEPVLLAEDALTPAGIQASSDEISAQDFLERPVFWATRRVQAAQANSRPARAKPAAVDVAELEEISLLGVFSSGKTAGIIAMVDGSEQRVAINENIMGWKVASISGRDVVVSKGGVRKTLAFEYETSWYVPEAEEPITKEPITEAREYSPEEELEPASSLLSTGGL